jgi:hypothetical protein
VIISEVSVVVSSDGPPPGPGLSTDVTTPLLAMDITPVAQSEAVLPVGSLLNR